MERGSWMKWLRAFFRHWARRSQTSSLLRSLPVEVDPAEEISSFVRYDGHLNHRTGTVKHEHFKPREVRGRFESSVYRTSGLTLADNWALIRVVFEEGRNNTAKARAYGPADAILNAGLSFDADGQPHPRHANIVGWDSSEKHLRKQQAMNFASAFRFEERPIGT